MRRFYAQFETWHWYAHEGRKWNDRHLLGIATAKMVLFGGRLILAHNEIFYPYHKWFLRLLERAPDKPPDLLARIAAVHHLAECPQREVVSADRFPVVNAHESASLE